jgi:outer membrane protein assembly factor BamB
MQTNTILSKALVIGIILLFVTTVVSPSIAGDVGKKKNSAHINEKQIASSLNTDWWPMFHHDEYHSGFSTSAAPDTNQILWNYTTGSNVSSSPAVADGKIFFCSNDENVYCLNANNGAYIWQYSAGDWIRSSPAIAYGNVYFGGGYSGVFCMKASDGTKLWRYYTGSKMDSSPAVSNNRVYIGSVDDHKLYCLNATTGAKIWDYTTDGEVYSSPAIFEGKVYVATYHSSNGILYCVNATTGVLIWDYIIDYEGDSSPLIYDGKVYIHGGNLYCLNASTGEFYWDFWTGLINSDSPSVNDGKIYISGAYLETGEFYCLNASNGETLWNFSPGGSIIFCDSAIADGKIYVGCDNHNIYCLNAETGVKIWSYSTGDRIVASPSIAEGKVYVSSWDGKVYCFGQSNQPPNPPNITGPVKAKIKVGTSYNFTTTDPDGDNVSYFIDWGDHTNSSWIGPYKSGATVTQLHTWTKKGSYTIKAKAKDIFGAESNWSTLSITMPLSYEPPQLQFFTWFFARFPHAFPILRHLLGY